MIRWCCSLLVFALVVSAGPASAPDDPEPKDGKVTIPLTLSPAAAPRPVSDYRLLPDYRDMQPGEKLSGFLKCFMEQNVFFNAENSEKRQEWLKLPLAELPADVREQAGIKNGIAYNPPYASLMVFMDQAARYNRVEWNEWFNLRKDGAYMLLPEVQKLRELASVLRLRMRGEVKNGEFDRAVVTAQTLFGLARMLEQHPTLIGNLVGIAIATATVHALEELVAQPGCPNLFWSLADLPSPFIDLRHGLGGERVFLAAQFEGLTKAQRPLAPAELDVYIKYVTELGAMADSSNALGRLMQKPKVRYALIAADVRRMEAARKRLVESGMSPDLAKALPEMQVALLDDLHRYEILRDETFMWVNLPYPIAEKGIREADAALVKSRGDSILAPLLLPSVGRVKNAQARLDQRIALLRVIEAVRLHAHDNGGQLPGSLDQIKLPLPHDPISGKPFEYTVRDGFATLHGQNPLPGSARLNRYIELRIRK